MGKSKPKPVLATCDGARPQQSQNSLLIRNGRVIDPSRQVDTIQDIFIRDGRIVSTRELFPTGFNPVGNNEEVNTTTAARVIDASGFIVVPGLIDMHVHLREPGREDEETIASGSRAAAKGGFTTIACMPNTQPVADRTDIIEMILSQAQRCGVVNVHPIASITKNLAGEEITDIPRLIQAGAVAISDDGNTVMNAELMRQALMFSAEYHFPVIAHCEDHNLSAGGVINRGVVSEKLNLPGMPSIAEDVIVARDILLAESTGGHLHIAHVSTARSVELIRAGKERGVRVTAEATPHHFTLTEAAVEQYGAYAKMNPPLRTQADVDAIRAGLRDGTIDAIATDHAPHTETEKALGMRDAHFGIVGLDTCVPLVITQLVNTGCLTLSEAIAKLTCMPATILNLNTKYSYQRGTLCAGAIADITIIDPNKEAKVDTNTFASQSKNTPFAGWTLKGWPIMTIVGGNIVEVQAKRQEG